MQISQEVRCISARFFFRKWKKVPTSIPPKKTFFPFRPSLSLPHPAARAHKSCFFLGGCHIPRNSTGLLVPTRPSPTHPQAWDAATHRQQYPPLLHFLTPLLFYGNFLCSRRHTDSPDSVQENSLLSLFLLPPPIFQHFFGGAQKKNSGSNTCPPAPPKTRCNMSRGRILAKKRSWILMNNNSNKNKGIEKQKGLYEDSILFLRTRIRPPSLSSSMCVITRSTSVPCLPLLSRRGRSENRAASKETSLLLSWTNLKILLSVPLLWTAKNSLPAFLAV